MPQFLLGFWCGCVFSVLTGCSVIYSLRKKKERKATKEQKDTAGNRSQNKEPAAAAVARILLVDDSKLSRRLIRDFLKDKPIAIEEAGNGAECLSKCRRYSFDLAFVDFNMPGGSGKETLDRLRQEKVGTSQPPMIVMGSNIRQENEAEYLEMGFAGCLAKPIQRERLEEVLLLNLPEEALQPIPPGFSYQNGLKNFDGNEELYKETMVLFSSLWEERREQLKAALDEEDMKQYAVIIHSIKGDARILGADALGELAYKQELLAKEGNAEAVRNSFSETMEAVTKIADYFVSAFSA